MVKKKEVELTVKDSVIKDILTVKLIVEKLKPEAVIPQFATEGSMCFDLHAIEPEPVTIFSGRSYTFSTGLAFQIPKGYGMEIYGRSGLGFRHGVRLVNCTACIDSDYRKEVLVRLHNDSGYDHYTVNPGDRVAQARLVKLVPTLIEEGKIEETERGGFGSTGK